MVTSVPLWLWCERLSPTISPSMTAISSCKIVRPSASNNLQSKQTWRSLTFIETSDPVHWCQFSSCCTVFADRQVLRFRFNNEEKFLLGLLLLVLAALGLATDGWLELIILNGENIIWPHWFSPRGCVPPRRHGQMEHFTGWAEGRNHAGRALCSRAGRHGLSLLRLAQNPGVWIRETQGNTRWPRGRRKHPLANRMTLRGTRHGPQYFSKKNNRKTSQQTRL